MKIETALAGADVAGLMDASASARARTAKLADGAHQFEAMMLEEMLKPLKFGESPDAAGGTDDGAEGGTGANGTIQGYGTEALAKAISNGGGFGLARQIIRQVTQEDGRKQSPAVSKVS
jgi:Rod binding domain-containing protein